MNNLNSEKYSLAWFKLSEFVLRREKEKALGILRLLVHSLNDKALALKLEGDLLYAFNDTKSADCYSKAAQLYFNSNNFMEALTLYEHLFGVNSDNTEYANKILELHHKLKDESKILKSFNSLTDLLIKKRYFRELNDLCQQSSDFFVNTNIIHEHLILSALKNDYKDREFIDSHFQKAILFLMEQKGDRLNQFLVKISSLDAELKNELVKKFF